MKTDVAIIGAGAAGLMCALFAGRGGSKVLVLERSENIGRRILISGGGRCNFTNLNVSSKNYISGNPHFVKSALSRFAPQDFMAFLKKHETPFYEKEEGQMFCRGPSRLVIGMLHEECVQNGVKILSGVKIESVKKRDQFEIVCNGKIIECGKLVVATGGISHLELGATDFGFKIARQFGITITKLKPGLVPLVLDKTYQDFKALSGISFKAKVSLGHRSFIGDVLFTHTGLSGPAILNISSFWNEGEEIVINIFPAHDAIAVLLDEKKKNGNAHLKNILAHYIPKRFADTWCSHYASSKPIRTYSEKALRKIWRDLQNWKIRPSGTLGFSKAEVMVGGVDTNEISSKTMESKKVPGLYFIGEVVDVAGELGGYNLHWAWSSGHAAGENLISCPSPFLRCA